ncbi:hypothetical protein EW146_g5231 [Bondarzewia mesenterica]|uniref:Beta-mannosidase B n=1 Tax=Bondarzewia mesenterica TaxID=1095465 RepID=A0A4V3XEX1_9AGAM|nr:hypothetical protein EW146_g5231 [Bondarzewia mesenterica]
MTDVPWLFKVSVGWSMAQVGGGKSTYPSGPTKKPLFTASEEWLPVSEVPTCVHTELLKHGKIPDPFIGLNEWDVQWIGEADWTFKTTFSVPKELLSTTNLDLVFDGLDTFATVKLNNHEILKAENQFVSYRTQVKKYLKLGDDNQQELQITFASAFIKGRELEKKHGKFNLWNGDSSRLHVRKAQYNYGWDWGPTLMTAGPWRPIFIHAYEARITDLRISSTVSPDLKEVDLTVDITLSSQSDSTATVSLKTLSGSEVDKKKGIKFDDGKCQVKFHFKKGEVELWFPVGYGKQPIYEVEVVVEKEDKVLEKKTEKIGFRRARVIEEDLDDGKGLSFIFEINNVRIFCGGSNWIPADSFLTKMTRELYHEWLKLLVDGNQNMVRVWGGGIYEADDFYEICDELGILVWQDFPFACGQYPAYSSFLDNFSVEAEQNIKRLRHHPSIVILAGNNEDYQIAEQFGLDLDYSQDEPPTDFLQTNFPARHIYETVLPCGQRQTTTSQHHGDLHQWNVWHGSQEPWHNWDNLYGRFVSEFGMQAYPNIRTVDHWLGGNTSERFPQSRTTVNHNKADGFERRLAMYVMENFKHVLDMESYVYYTQIMQSEALATAYRLWRRNWGGPGKQYTSGALVWQFNDCWPVTSWSIVDYFRRPKPAYYAIARELRPYTVGMTRKDNKVYDNDLSAASFTITSVKLDVTSFDLDDPRWQDHFDRNVTLAANASTQLWDGLVPGQPPRTKDSEIPKTIIVSARLLDHDGTVLGRVSNWLEPFKYIHFPAVKDLGFKIHVHGESVKLSTKRPIKGIVLDVEGEDVKWSDQAIDLVPGDDQTVEAQGLNGRKVKARFLGDGTA